MVDEDIAKLTIGTLKSVLFQNHVNATLMLEKSELVNKVMRLVEEERRERRERMEEEERERQREEEEAIERQRVLMEQHREREARQRAEREAQAASNGEEALEDMDDKTSLVDEARPNVPSDDAAAPSTPPKPKSTSPPAPSKSPASMAANLERTGLCVICQDEEANIAIVDCGCVFVTAVGRITLYTD